MSITISTNVYYVCLQIETFRIEERRIQVGRTYQMRRQRVAEVTEISSYHTPISVRDGFRVANQIFEPANIIFDLASSRSQNISISSNDEYVDDAGFLAIARRHPARRGINIFLVRNLSNNSTDGGSAVESIRACIVRSVSNPLFGKILAHEFGHLLDLGHAQGRVEDNYNLMYPGLRAGSRLTEPQLRTIEQSNLIQHVHQHSQPN